MTNPRDGGCACGAVRYRLASDPMFIALLPLPELPAADGKRVRHQPLDRGRPFRAARGRAACRSMCRATTAARSGSFAAPPARSPLYSEYGRPEVRFVRGRDARRPVVGHAGRPHLHEVEAGLGRAAGLGAGVRRLLRPTDAVAGREPRAAGRGAAATVVLMPVTMDEVLRGRGDAASQRRGVRPRPREVPRRPDRLPRVLEGRHGDGLRLPEGVARRTRRVGAREVLDAERVRHALHWVHARLDRLDADEMRDLVENAWALCVPKRVVDEYVAARD